MPDKVAAAPGTTGLAATAASARVPRGPERVAYSLIDNRLSAHLGRGGGLLLAGGSAGFAKYVRFASQLKGGKKTWDLRQTEGGVKVARMTGKTASVFVPLTAQQAQAGTLRVRIHAKEEGAFSVRVNEAEDKELQSRVVKGWQVVELDASRQLVEGENTLQLFVKQPGASVAWIQIGGGAPLADDGGTAFYDGKGALLLPKDGAMSWYVMIPERAQLVAEVSDAACQVPVAVTAEDGAKVNGTLAGKGSAIDLAAFGGKAVRLDLTGAGCAQVALAQAALVVPGAAPAVSRGKAPKHVLFIIMDSLRADRLKPFNPKARPDVPTFERLAQSATLFLQHYVQGTESQVSHASMWTSLYLAKHGASKMKDKLPDRWLTLDEVAKQAGMFVAGVSANGYIRPARGFGSAWDKYVNHIEKSMGLRGADIVEKGTSFIMAKKEQPWFLYLGLIDTHVTWRAKSPWIEKYDPGYKGRFEKSFGDDGPGGAAKDLTEREQEHVRALYDSNVSYQDDLLGKLIERLREWGVWDDTMLIITADHGDELWEDGKVFGHARGPLQTVIHVPLLIHYPPLFPAGKIQSGTEGIDILPTLAAALGRPLDPEWQGSSLIPLAHGAHAYPHLAVASQYENGHAGRIGNWKLRLAGTRAPELYHLARDPGENRDLWGDKSAAIGARLLLDPMWMLRQWNVEWKKSLWGNPASVTQRFAADLGE